ncbi:MAG: carboxypeptidase-like regulatory domain-containing protein [Hymenobacter sp.]|nr:MAG: carboxypeptidase-like regulatory domain-containing protein [Hymenobacter sp.]
MNRIFTQLSTLTLLLFLSISTIAQTIVTGTVTDGITQQPLSFASVYFKGSRGVTTDKDGHFKLGTQDQKVTTIYVSYTGYKAATQTIASNISTGE